MISKNLVFVQLAQYDDFVDPVELAMMLEASVAEVKKQLRELGDRVEQDDKGQWRIRQKNLNTTLNEIEKQERDDLEKSIEQAFFIAGKSLKILRDKKLYRETHTNFETYVKERFDFTRAAAYYLIAASEVVENLKCQQIVDKNQTDIVLPTKESQCRPLAKLPPEKQKIVWCSAVKKAKGKVPSAKIVKEIVAQSSSNSEINRSLKNREIVYKPGLGIDYVVHLEEETYRLLELYQAKIGTATKNGAIKRLLDDAIAG